MPKKLTHGDFVWVLEGFEPRFIKWCDDHRVKSKVVTAYSLTLVYFNHCHAMCSHKYLKLKHWNSYSFYKLVCILVLSNIHVIDVNHFRFAISHNCCYVNQLIWLFIPVNAIGILSLVMWKFAHIYMRSKIYFVIVAL